MLYQGDELGMPGAGDPVTRLPLPGRGALPAESRALEAHVRALAKLRACAPSLRRGAIEVLLASDEALVFAREDAASGDRALVALARAPSAPIRVPLPARLRGTVREYFQGDTTSLADELTIPASPTRTVRIWLPTESPCRAP